MIKDWGLKRYRTKVTAKILFVTCEDVRYQFTSEADNTVEELKCTQEEADTRLILNAARSARSGYQAVVVASEDTDQQTCSFVAVPSSALFRHP